MNKIWMMALAGAVLLAACGGGGDGNPAGGTVTQPPAPVAAGSDVPASATQDASAAYEFVASLTAGASDSADPITVGDATLATSETDEPRPL